MKINWKTSLGIVLTLAVLGVIAVPILWWSIMPVSGYGMMRGYAYHMPMMGGYGMMPFGMWFMWLIPLGVFILIGFAFGWAAHQFTHKSS